MNTVECSFCGEKDFDLVGLKYHLNQYCEIFAITHDPNIHKNPEIDEELCTCETENCYGKIIEIDVECPIHRIDEDRKQDDVEHSWEMLREARKEIISDDPDDNERIWEEDEAEDRQRERDRQDEINFKRGVDY